jgi:hypothetical protein
MLTYALLIGLAIGVYAVHSHIPAWGLMWILASSIFAGFKWLSLIRAPSGTLPINQKRAFQYLFLWPGMDAENFLSASKPLSKPSRVAWVFAVGKMFLGVWLFWWAARQVPDHRPLLQGWVGFFGLIFMLHFGLFHVAALFWQGQGLPVEPLMKMPIAARSLSDFWGHRWNLAFRTLARHFVFLPWLRIGSASGAMFLSFLMSGVLHDVVISIPAGSGYGLPTAYFLLQATGIWAEHSRVGQAMGLGAGLSGRLFAWLIAAGPAFWLFHPPFVRNVMIPFMKATKAL